MLTKTYTVDFPVILRYPRPKLVKVLGAPWYRSWVLALSHSISNFAGHPTICCYAVWTPRGPRRVWAF